MAMASFWWQTVVMIVFRLITVVCYELSVLRLHTDLIANQAAWLLYLHETFRDCRSKILPDVIRLILKIVENCFERTKTNKQLSF